jgi:hypothetical protein
MPLCTLPLRGRAVKWRTVAFLSYEAVDEILAEPNLPHMRETIIDDFDEYFDAA